MRLWKVRSFRYRDYQRLQTNHPAGLAYPEVIRSAITAFISFAAVRDELLGNPLSYRIVTARKIPRVMRMQTFNANTRAADTTGRNRAAMSRR